MCGKIEPGSGSGVFTGQTGLGLAGAAGLVADGAFGFEVSPFAVVFCCEDPCWLEFGGFGVDQASGAAKRAKPPTKIDGTNQDRRRAGNRGMGERNGGRGNEASDQAMTWIAMWLPCIHLQGLLTDR